MPFIYGVMQEEYGRLCRKKEQYREILADKSKPLEERERVKKYRKSVRVDMKLIEKVLSKKDQRIAKKNAKKEREGQYVVNVIR